MIAGRDTRRQRGISPGFCTKMAKKKPNLADYVEASERRDAPKARARAVGAGGSGALKVWLLIAIAVLLLAGFAFVRFKHLI